MSRRPIPSLLCLLFVACIEQRAHHQFDATLTRLCIAASPAQAPDTYFQTQPHGCVLLTIDSTLAAGLDEVGVESGVYRTQSRNLGFTAYLDDVIVARTQTTLAVMTPAAFQELAQAAAAVHEARLEAEHLREGLGLVLLGNLQSFAPTQPRPLTSEQLALLRKALSSR